MIQRYLLAKAVVPDSGFSMKPAGKSVLVLVTAPNLKVARKLAQSALNGRLVACANLIPKIESHYWWQDKIESSAEVLVVFKTARPCLVKLEKLIVTEHPYDTPEFLVVPLKSGNARYLDWLANSMVPAKA